MPTNEGRKTLDGYVEGLAPEQQAILAAIWQLVREAAPNLVEAFKWAQPVWEFNGPVCYAKVFPSAINLGFWRGAELAERVDHDRLLVGDGSKMRHLRLTSVGDIRSEPLVRLIRAAVELNQRFGDPTKGEATRTR